MPGRALPTDSLWSCEPRRRHEDWSCEAIIVEVRCVQRLAVSSRAPLAGRKQIPVIRLRVSGVTLPEGDVREKIVY